jgi:hypothetical protein
MTEAAAVLHVFEGECDWIVARDLDDAWAVALEQWGGVMSDYGERDDFAQLPNDQPLSIWDGEDGPGTGTKVTKTCAEWIAEHGRGWLCGTEF